MTAFISHSDCLKHEMLPEHPECPGRLHAIEDRLKAAGIMDYLHQYTAPKATREQLARAHSMRHVAEIFAAAPRSGLVRIDPDTAMDPHTLDASLHAAGALVLAADLVIEGRERNAFCSVRPPGHHAERDRAMGFCFFNNVAVGILHALDAHGLQRVALVDFDVHHGNGSEDIFNGDPRVLLCSSFQHPLYPYRAGPSIPGRRVNVPLPAGAGGREFRAALSEQWLPAIEAFEPQMIFISAGFDAHREDPLASLNLVESDYVWVTKAIMHLAGEFAAGRIVSTLEGGYALSALGRSATAHVRTLLGLE
ncbi:MAG: Histone deacetylase-like amidohydrolase [Gammaproteobacteria bacterium]|nr:Histone deacetylase-like amidohydrolase [Gammaproteobacteria bacterium]